MLELLLCSMFTILPDYLFRRYVQKKRLKKEITIFTVWYELRWGITGCLILTISLITMVFYFHPSTTSVSATFRAVAILPEAGGRVEKVYVGLNDRVERGALLFQLENSRQEAQLETARRRIAEVEAQIVVAREELATADAAIVQARSAEQQAEDELATKTELSRRNSNVVAAREIERLQVALDGSKGAVAAEISQKQTLETKIAVLLPAQRASAEAELAQAQVEFDKTFVKAGVTGTVQQFALQPGDVVNPLLRPAGILVPDGSGERRLVAGFNQIEAKVLKRGMIAEATCAARPYTIIPLVVTDVQNVIAAGQFRPTDRLLDAEEIAQEGTITAFLEPLYLEQSLDIPPGSTCIANVYTDNHAELQDENTSTGRRLFLHAVDAVGLVHAMILRMQAVILPVRTLVFGGH